MRPGGAGASQLRRGFKAKLAGIKIQRCFEISDGKTDMREFFDHLTSFLLLNNGNIVIFAGIATWLDWAERERMKDET
jgi:hypothetical protein